MAALLCAVFCTPATAQQPVRVLFVGNSLTSAHNIPGIVAELALSAGKQMDYRVYAPGGRKLVQHASDPHLHKMIRSQKWDFVVLQEQSQLPAFRDSQLQRQVFPHARSLSRLIKANDPHTTVVFYMTMAHQHGDRMNAPSHPAVGTYNGMQQRIARAYLRMGKDNKGIVAPVGIAWQRVREDKPVISLYGDNIHPGPTGAYLAACVLYATLFDDSPIGLYHPDAIGNNQARYLQEAADDTVFGSGQTWKWN